jgi:hypothetical protein
MKAYVVTEGAYDAALVPRALTSAGLENVHVAAAGGRSSAVSLARSILRSRRRPVALVMDADTTDPTRVREQAQVLSDLVFSDGVSGSTKSASFRVFLAVPVMESVAQEAAGADRRLGEFEPMRSLISFLRTKGPNAGDEPPHH